jgi:hypothetical protein
MRPTIGRIVHFHDEGGPYAAIVVRVYDNAAQCVDLVTFGSRSIYFQPNVPEWMPVDVNYADGTNLPQPGWWTWPPREEAPPKLAAGALLGVELVTEGQKP